MLDATEFADIQNEWRERGELKRELVRFLTSLPRETHPMTMLSQGLLYLQTNSQFAKLYGEGKLQKKEYWEYMYEDSMDLLAKIPKIAAIAYRHKYGVPKH